jgi:hypothetical protein
MFDIETFTQFWLQCVKVYCSNLARFKLYRRYKGGLWVHFKNGSKVQTMWTNKNGGYISHPTDGGVFHKDFNLIAKIEDFS